MNRFELYDRAQAIADTHSIHELARAIVKTQEQLNALDTNAKDLHEFAEKRNAEILQQRDQLEVVAECVFHGDRRLDCIQHSGQLPCMTQSEIDLCKEVGRLRARLGEAIANEKQAMAYLQEVRMMISPNRDFPTMINEARRNVRTAELALKFAKAKGRFHSQLAMCDLFEHLGLPCVRPHKDKKPTPEKTEWLDDAVSNGTKALDEYTGYCRCDLRQKTLGDGCSICNPELAEELSDPEM